MPAAATCSAAPQQRAACTQRDLCESSSLHQAGALPCVTSSPTQAVTFSSGEQPWRRQAHCLQSLDESADVWLGLAQHSTVHIIPDFLDSF